MKLNIKEMISGNPSRLRYVFRYSTSRVNHPESVAEHSFFVAFYCLLISRWVVEHGQIPERNDTDIPFLDLQNLLQRAVLHDLEEARSGDFPRPFKHSSPEIKAVLEKASQKAFEQVLTPVIGPPNPNAEEPEEYESDRVVHDEYICSWLDSKDGTPEGRILEFADFLSVLGFLMEEGCGSGNSSIQGHVQDMDEYFLKFSGEEFSFIRPLVDQTAEIMKGVFGGK